MKLPLSWLQEYVQLDDSIEGIAASLVRLGHEIEAIETPRADLQGVLIGRIIDKQQHPNADRLSVLSIDIAADQPLAIVCGAQNMQQGDCIPVATLGSCLPNGLKIKKGKIRGVVSFGMCCSAVELGLADDADGLLILPSDAVVGMAVADYLALEEAVFDVSITPNRGDCMSVRGLARDLAALYGQDFCLPAVEEIVATGKHDLTCRIEAPEDAPLYMTRRLSGLCLKPSADALQRRLLAAGMRPVNGVVDLLNELMLDCGQPMHAFDAAKIKGDVRVCLAVGGESFRALDGHDYVLKKGDLCIADECSILALAGVMGSESSAVSDETTEVLLESAYFRPAGISLTRRRHGMVSEASMRFERGVDPEGVAPAMDRATAKMMACFSASASECDIHRNAALLPTEARVSFPRSFIAQRLGVSVASSFDAVLERMGFDVCENDGVLSIRVPTFRHDVTQPEDLLEEYARVLGYDQIPAVLPELRLSAVKKPDSLLDDAIALGAVQVIQYAFISAQQQRLFVADDGADLLLANPISAEMSVMRRSLWAGLLQVAQHNMSRQQDFLSLVEQGKTYVKAEDASIDERRQMAWLLAGKLEDDQWYASARQADFYDLKGMLESWLLKRGVQARFVAIDGQQGLQDGQTAQIVLGRTVLGRIGKLDENIAAGFGLDLPVFLASINIDALPGSKLPRFEAIPEYPASQRDLVFLFARDVSVDTLLQTARKAAGPLLLELRIFDRYVGEGVDEDKLSLGLRFYVQSRKKTLTQEDVDGVAANIIAAMQKHFSASLRG